MKKITKILRIIPTLDPKFGGPANAIIDSSNLLVKKGIKVDILTNDKKFNVNLKKDINIYNIGRGIGSYNFSLRFINGSSKIETNTICLLYMESGISLL